MCTAVACIITRAFLLFLLLLLFFFFFFANTCTLYTSVIYSYSLSFSDKEIDFKNVDLKKMRVKQLKKILINWGEDCRGCAEKTDFINKIETVMHQHVEL